MTGSLSVIEPRTLEIADLSQNTQKAQRLVGAAMAACLALWFLPIISGAACSAIESALIDKILKVLGCYSKDASEKVFWFFRGKTFFLFGATYLPVAGVPVQLFETYGLGQFAIHCALRPALLDDAVWLEQSWKDVAPDIFSGPHAIQSYEQSTGSTFPDFAREKFISTVDLVNKLYLATQRFPRVVKAQEGLGEFVHGATLLGKRVGADLFHLVTGK
jgi:hypothetical protein